MPIERFGEEEEKNVQACLRSGRLSEYFKTPLGGPCVQEFEQRLALIHKTPYAVACSSGTAALHIALAAAYENTLIKGRNWPQDSRRVVVTPYSFIASATAPLMVNLSPVFVDIDPDDYTIPNMQDPPVLRYGVKHIVPVNILGSPADYDNIQVPDDGAVIEDNAQGLGAKYKDKPCGSLGTLSTFSFQYTKVITTGGEGGLVLTRDLDLYQKCLAIRSHGSQYLDAPYLTYNYRMTEPQAAFGCAQLDKLDEFLGIQKRNADYVVNHLPDALQPPKTKPWAEHAYFLIACRFNEELAGMTREQFVEKCGEQGVNKNTPGAMVSKGYTVPLYEKPVLKPYKAEPLKNVEETVKHSVFLDIHRWRTLDETKEDLEKMAKILDGGG